MLVMNRAAESLACAVLQQVRKLVATGVCQQIKGVQLTAEITPPVNLPAGKPATGCARLLFSLNHAKAVGNSVLSVLRIEAVIRGIARPYPTYQRAVGSTLLNPGGCRLPEDLLRNGAHYFAEPASVRVWVTHGS